MRARAVVLVSALVVTAACAGARAPTPTSGSGGSGTGGSTGGAGGGQPNEEIFGTCTNPNGADGGVAKPGAPCIHASDCTTACCPCAHGQVLYAYEACAGGRCASICDPVNDTRAPVCADGGDVVVGCMKCAQILAEALADGDQLGALACPGSAATAWGALSTCAASACSASCPGITPTSACVTCIEAPDSAGGCADEIAACQSS